MQRLYKFYIAHAHGCFMDPSERYLARSMFSCEDTADTQLHHSAQEFLRSHVGCIHFSEPQTILESKADDECKVLWKKHEDDIEAIQVKYTELLRKASEKLPRSALMFESDECNKLINERANEYRKVDDEYSTARDAVYAKCEEAKKEWRIYKAEDVDAFIKKCQAYNKEKKKSGLQFYCTIDRKKDNSGFPYVDMGYCKMQVED
jgi:hypothetical protein